MPACFGDFTDFFPVIEFKARGAELIWKPGNVLLKGFLIIRKVCLLKLLQTLESVCVIVHYV